MDEIKVSEVSAILKKELEAAPFIGVGIGYRF